MIILLGVYLLILRSENLGSKVCESRNLGRFLSTDSLFFFQALYPRALTTECAVVPFNWHWSDSWARILLSSPYLWLVLWTKCLYPFTTYLLGCALVPWRTRITFTSVLTVLLSLLSCASCTFRLVGQIRENSGCWFPLVTSQDFCRASIQLKV